MSPCLRLEASWTSLRHSSSSSQQATKVASALLARPPGYITWGSMLLHYRWQIIEMVVILR